MPVGESRRKSNSDVEGVVRRQGDERLHPGARASGGTGRRAWLRAMSPQGGGGSSPPSPTEKIPHHRAFHAARRPSRLCPASAALFNDDGAWSDRPRVDVQSSTTTLPTAPSSTAW